MGSRVNDLRIMGLPAQFVVVVVISLALTIYFGAWAADARKSGRAAASVQTAGQFDFDASASASSSAGISGGLPQSPTGKALAYGNPTEGQGWEKMFLFACPLH